MKSFAIASMYLFPNKAPVFVNEAVATNHQEEIEWLEYAAYTKTIERKEYLQNCILSTEIDKEIILNQFLKPPLYHTNYEKSFGTLYTASYKPEKREVDFIWPRKKITLGFTNFEEKKYK